MLRVMPRFFLAQINTPQRYLPKNTTSNLTTVIGNTATVVYSRGSLLVLLDVKPLNLIACFITKCDAKCYYYVPIKNGGLWTTVYNNVQALVILFLAYNISIEWREEFYMQ